MCGLGAVVRTLDALLHLNLQTYPGMETLPLFQLSLQEQTGASPGVLSKRDASRCTRYLVDSEAQVL